MSYGIASSRPATARTSFGGTNRNSGFGSMKRVMSHGQAMRSTRARSRVTHFMLVLLSQREDDEPHSRARGNEHRLGHLESPRHQERRRPDHQGGHVEDRPSREDEARARDRAGGGRGDAG